MGTHAWCASRREKRSWTAGSDDGGVNRRSTVDEAFKIVSRGPARGLRAVGRGLEEARAGGRGGAGEGRWGFIMGEGGLYCTGVIVSEPDGVVMDDLGGRHAGHGSPVGASWSVLATRANDATPSLSTGPLIPSPTLRPSAVLPASPWTPVHVPPSRRSRPQTARVRRLGMPGSDLDELYSAYSRSHGLTDDELDVDSPVLGLWADEDDKRAKDGMQNRRPGECTPLSSSSRVPVLAPRPLASSSPRLSAQRSRPATVSSCARSCLPPVPIPSSRRFFLRPDRRPLSRPSRRPDTAPPSFWPPLSPRLSALVTSADRFSFPPQS